MSPGVPQDCFLDTVDGVHLAATVYPVPGGAARHAAPSQPEKRPPGLVLVHDLGANRRSWQPFASRAQEEGYLCLAIDLRGHGDSTTANGSKISYRNFTTRDWLAALNDIDAAKQAIVARGADPDNLALVGAGLGANLALAYAVDHADIPAVVLVSPGLDIKGVQSEDAIRAYDQRPALLMTATGDSYSATSCSALKRAASGLCEQREYAGAAHGAALLDASQTATDQIFLWLVPIIKLAPHPQDNDVSS